MFASVGLFRPSACERASLVYSSILEAMSETRLHREKYVFRIGASPFCSSPPPLPLTLWFESTGHGRRLPHHRERFHGGALQGGPRDRGFYGDRPRGQDRQRRRAGETKTAGRPHPGVVFGTPEGRPPTRCGFRRKLEFSCSAFFPSESAWRCSMRCPRLSPGPARSRREMSPLPEFAGSGCKSVARPRMKGKHLKTRPKGR